MEVSQAFRSERVQHPPPLPRSTSLLGGLPRRPRPLSSSTGQRGLVRSVLGLHRQRGGGKAGLEAGTGSLMGKGNGGEGGGRPEPCLDAVVPACCMVHGCRAAGVPSDVPAERTVVATRGGCWGGLAPQDSIHGVQRA